MVECRLCGGSEGNLVNIYDGRFVNAKSIRSYILLATGIEIKKDDVVSKLVCPTCMKMTFNMYLFRVKASKNDSKLKEEAGVSKENEDNNNKPKNKAAINLDQLQIEFNSQTFGDVECEAEEGQHKSITDVLSEYPNLVLPKEILGFNLLPKVSLVRCDEKKTVRFAESVNTKRKLSVESSDDEFIMPKKVRPGPASSKIISDDEDTPIQSTELIGGKRLNTYICDYCSEVFTNKKKLKSHIVQHRREQAAVMREIENLDDSFMVVAKTNDVFVCDVCNELFTSKKKLSYHSKEHNPCKFCNEKFMTAASLEDHTKQCREAIISNKFTLELTRCEDIPEIRSQYASAFEDEEEEEEIEPEPIVEIEDDDVVMVPESDEILEPPIITNEFDYIKSIFEREKRACGNTILKKVLDRPSCKSTNNSITFYGLHNDIMKQIKIPVVLKSRTDCDSIEGKIVQPPLPVVNSRTFDFSDIEPTVILAANKFKTVNKIRMNPIVEPKKLQPKVSLMHEQGMQNYNLPKPMNQPLPKQMVELRRVPKPNPNNGHPQLRVCNNQALMHNGQVFTGPVRISGGLQPIAYPGQSNGTNVIKLVISNQNQMTPPPTILNSTFRPPMFQNPQMMPLIQPQPPPPPLVTTALPPMVTVKPENMLKLRIKEPWEINNS